MTEVDKLNRVIAASRTGKVYAAFGKSFSLTQWAAYTDIQRETLAKRIRKGWDIERALSESATVGNNQFLRY